MGYHGVLGPQTLIVFHRSRINENRQSEKEKEDTAGMDPDKIRYVPGWEDAPVPVCFGGDARALAFCCKYVHAMPPGFECRRDEKLAEIGLSVEEFIALKEEFSQSEGRDWHVDHVCWGSLAYCCLRTSGCKPRDKALRTTYPGQDMDDILEEYYSQKKMLAQRLLDAGTAGKK